MSTYKVASWANPKSPSFSVIRTIETEVALFNSEAAARQYIREMEELEKLREEKARKPSSGGPPMSAKPR